MFVTAYKWHNHIISISGDKLGTVPHAPTGMDSINLFSRPLVSQSNLPRKLVAEQQLYRRSLLVLLDAVPAQDH